jgi:hypothetical protein
MMTTTDEAAGFAELAAAERSRSQAAREHAAVTAAAARAAMAEAQQEAAQIVADAEDAVRQADGEADGAVLAAEIHDARAALLEQADALGDAVEAAGAIAGNLAVERVRLEQQAAELDARLEQLADDQAATEAALATALEEGDVDAITASRGRLAAIGEVRDRLSPELAAPRAAVAAIGDTEGAGRLAEVIATGRARQAELWGTLCALADDEDAPDAVRALAALERDAVAGRASAEAAAVSAQIAPLCEALAVVLARVPGERAEIERRRDLPYRMMAARIRLANLAGAYKGREAALSAQLQAAEDWMTRLAECDPATVADVLAGGVRCRGQMAGLLETVGAPLPPDDLDTSTEGKRAALLEELTDDAWLAPADVPQGRPSTVVIR